MDYVVEQGRVRFLDDRHFSAALRKKVAAHRNNKSLLDRTYLDAKEDEAAVLGGGLVLTIFVAGVVWLVFNQTAAIVTAIVFGLLSVALAIFDPNNDLKITNDDKTELWFALKELELPPPCPLREVAARPFGPERVLMLVAVALDVAEKITKTRSWSSTYLDAHRVQLAPRKEAGQVLRHGYALHKAISELGPAPQGTTASAIVAQRAVDLAREPLNLVWDRLLQRVTALDDYYRHLIALDIELDNADAARRALGLNDQIGDLLVDAVGDQFATDHLRRLSDEAATLTHAINELVDALNGNLETLLALAPLSSDDVIDH
ncbi:MULTISPECIES: hypothetical protein [unclassified Rhodococcus (in: high G+C Gram-positive bacteria)]|uniref:hypothetical protein n=1 Tax=unclassified Rhodococcus (in: high G+C Gram-positive bacteria) TaxID=192944 RepID=UPI001386AE60|nr:hypothetical protein [Rhodococcus sp. AH-ZY2]NCL77975.1 hypothetical protein [Rhodococcus sp. YH1]NCL78656.1 hypothetical protein [Rhodococcus sp. YH1]WML60857.1 hypothetical protein QNA09_00415 [Rhodococcus sp. AH-ZY2]